jgi:hypothetical protein
MPGRSHILACSTNGLPPDALSGGLGSLVGLGFEGTAPVDGATGVAVTVIVRVTFNKPMVVAPSVTVSDPAGGVVKGSVAIDGANILFTPSSPLVSALTYTVVVDGGQSLDGDQACGLAGLGGPCHLAFTFTTL